MNNVPFFDVSTATTDIKIGTKGVNEVIQNVRTILKTIKGTVYLDRTFGISSSILDQPTQVAMMNLQNEIYDAIEKYEPRAKIIKINFSADDNGTLSPKVTFKIKEGVLL